MLLTQSAVVNAHLVPNVRPALFAAEHQPMTLTLETAGDIVTVQFSFADPFAGKAFLRQIAGLIDGMEVENEA